MEIVLSLSFRWQWQNPSPVFTQLLWEDGELGPTNPWPPNNLLAEFSLIHQLLPQKHPCEIRNSEVRAVLTIMEYLTSFNPLVLWSKTWFQCGPLLSWSQQNSVIRAIQCMWLHRYFFSMCSHTFLQPKVWFYYKFPLTCASTQRDSVPDDFVITS